MCLKCIAKEHIIPHNKMLRENRAPSGEKSALVTSLVSFYYNALTGNLITMLHLLKNETSSNASHVVSDIIQNVRIIFETSDTRLLEALCDVNTAGKNDVRQKYLKLLWRKVPSHPEHRY